MKYDVVVIGTGPAGIFAALELLTLKPNIRILMVDKGKSLQFRHCPANTHNTKCVNCNPCSIMSGWGGAGAFSDGKLTLTTEYGGWLNDYLGKEKVQELIAYIDDIYLRFGGTEVTFGSYTDAVREIEKNAAIANLKLIPSVIRHLGTEKNLEILGMMLKALAPKVEIWLHDAVEEILIDDMGVRLNSGMIVQADYIIAAPGRNGATWLEAECKRLCIPVTNNQVDIGVRVEVPASILEHITDTLYESKLVYYTAKSFDDRVRTFCMNPRGHVVIENTDGIMTVNGHSFSDPNRLSNNTNFALLVSSEFTEPFKEPIAYGKYIARLANMLGGGVIVQRLGDLKRGRRSTVERIERGLVVPTLKSAVPGDLSLVLPHRHMVDIMEMLEALDKVIPGVASTHTLLYGVEVKFYSARLSLSNQLETLIPNLFAIGDGAGVTRGLAQASASGVYVARTIAERLE